MFGPQALVVFAKEPEPGRVKTRLCPPLGHEEAAALYTAFVEDTCALVRRQAFRDDRVVLYAPGGPGPVLSRIAAEFGLQTAAQEGVDLGARMAAAIGAELARGAKSVLLFGTDAPHVRPAHVRLAQESVGMGQEVFLGPALDGGYWCIGAYGRVPDLFEGIPWSTRDVLTATLERAAAKKLQVALGAWYRDVDDAADLRLLAALLATHVRSAEAASHTPASRTQAAIADLATARPEIFRGGTGT